MTHFILKAYDLQLLLGIVYSKVTFWVAETNVSRARVSEEQS